jgi:hypothetical protein
MTNFGQNTLRGGPRRNFSHGRTQNESAWSRITVWMGLVLVPSRVSYTFCRSRSGCDYPLPKPTFWIFFVNILFSESNAQATLGLSSVVHVYDLSHATRRMRLVGCAFTPNTSCRARSRLWRHLMFTIKRRDCERYVGTTYLKDL